MKSSSFDGSAEVLEEDDVDRILSSMKDELRKSVIGKEDILEDLLICLVSGGHALVEGVPGVAKTTIVKEFAQMLDLSFSRIQFTPDLMPTDVLGGNIYDQDSGEFNLRKGPVFNNVVLADEINRAPPKTQSALLESMQEYQVTIEGETLKLPKPFLLIATQNPIELEGTFSLPEAEKDRFMMKIDVDHPTDEEELELIKMKHQENEIQRNIGNNVEKLVKKENVEKLSKMAYRINASDAIMKYIKNIVVSTRKDDRLELGGSPRATEHLLKASKAQALLNGREYTIPDDVKKVTPKVLVHRIILSTDAQMEDITTKEIIKDILKQTKVPKK